MEKLITYTLLIVVSGAAADLFTDPLLYWIDDSELNKARSVVFSFLWFVIALFLCFVEAKSRAK